MAYPLHDFLVLLDIGIVITFKACFGSESINSSRHVYLLGAYFSKLVVSSIQRAWSRTPLCHPRNIWTGMGTALASPWRHGAKPKGGSRLTVQRRQGKTRVRNEPSNPRPWGHAHATRYKIRITGKQYDGLYRLKVDVRYRHVILADVPSVSPLSEQN